MAPTQGRHGLGAGGTRAAQRALRAVGANGAQARADEEAAKKWKPAAEKHRVRAEKLEQLAEQMKQGQIEQSK